MAAAGTGVQGQPPAETVFSDCEPGELKYRELLFHRELSHFGQLTFYIAEKTAIFSKLWWQLQQLYSKIGISPHSVTTLHKILSTFGFGLFWFRDFTKRSISWNSFQRSDFQSIATKPH